MEPFHRFGESFDNDKPSSPQQSNKMEEFNWLAEYNENDWVDLPPKDAVAAAENPPPVLTAKEGGEMIEMSDEEEFDDKMLETPPSSQIDQVSRTLRSQRTIIDDDDDGSPVDPPTLPITSDAPAAAVTKEDEWSE